MPETHVSIKMTFSSLSNLTFSGRDSRKKAVFDDYAFTRHFPLPSRVADWPALHLMITDNASKFPTSHVSIQLASVCILWIPIHTRTAEAIWARLTVFKIRSSHKSTVSYASTLVLLREHLWVVLEQFVMLIQNIWIAMHDSQIEQESPPTDRTVRNATTHIRASVVTDN